MTILVTGATGRIGRHVVEQLVGRGADVRALTRDPAKATLPAGVEVVQGDELTQAIITLNVAREAGVERMLGQMGFSATILRPTYFINNEVMVKDVILQHGVYPMPIGSKGVAMVDTRGLRSRHAPTRHHDLDPQASQSSTETGQSQSAPPDPCSGSPTTAHPTQRRTRSTSRPP